MTGPNRSARPVAVSVHCGAATPLAALIYRPYARSPASAFSSLPPPSTGPASPGFARIKHDLITERGASWVM